MEPVNLKRTPPVMWESVELLNRFQVENALFKHSGELEHPTATFGYTVYTKLPLPLHRDGAKRSIAGVPP
jgi:hypothetical protein